MDDNKNGRWVTMNGTHVFIKNGQSPEEALAELNSKKKPEKYYTVTSPGYMGRAKFLVSDNEIDKYDPDLYVIEETNIDNELAVLDKLDLDRPVSSLENDIRLSISEPHLRKYIINQLHERVAEHQMKLADDFLSNVPKHKDISAEESLLAVNSDRYNESKTYEYNDPKNAAYTYNCQRCAAAFVLRHCHGYDVQAKPSENVWVPSTSSFASVGSNVKLWTYAEKFGYDRTWFGTRTGWCGWSAVIFNLDDVRETMVDADDMARELGNEDMYKGTRHQIRYINKTVKEAGDGAVYICNVAWKGTKKKNGTYSGHTFCIMNDKGKVKFIDPQSGQECSRYFTENQIVPAMTLLYRADNCRLNGTVMKEVVDYE